jgi:hypothetical protein
MFATVMTRPPIPLRAHFEEPLPAHVEAIVDRCLQKDRAARYASMPELARDLRAAVAAA